MAYVYRNNFTSGELSPELEARPDLKEYSNGLRVCKNFIPKVQGGLFARPGIKKVVSSQVYDDGKNFRLLPYIFSVEEAYAAVVSTEARRVSPGYVQETIFIKLFTREGVLEGNSNVYNVGPYPGTDNVTYEIYVDEFAQQLDVMVLPVRNAKVMGLPGITRLSSGTFIGSSEMRKGAYPGTDFAAKRPKTPFSATWAGTFQGTLPGTYYQTCRCSISDVPSTGGALFEDLTTVGVAYKVIISGVPYYAQLVGLSVVGADFDLQLRFADNAEIPSSTACTIHWDAIVDEGTPPGGTRQMFNYKVSAVTRDGREHDVSLPWAAEADPLSTEHGIRIMWGPPYGASGITWRDIAYYRVYKSTTVGAFALYGWIGDTEIPVFIDNNIAPSGADAPFSRNLEHVGPSCAAFYQQRLVVAGGSDVPVTYTSSQLGNPFYFRKRVPTRADDAFQTTAYVSRFDRILHMIDRGTLYLFTEGGISIINQGSSGVYSADTAGVTQISTGFGSSAACKPVLVGTDILYVPRTGDSVRRLDAQNVDVDLTLRARHLFEGDTIRQLAHMDAPRPMVFCLLESGKLLSMCYEPNEQVWAWSSMEFSVRGSASPLKVDGVICLPDGNVDQVYLMGEGAIYSMDFTESGYVGLDDWFPATVNTTDPRKITCAQYAGETADVVADGLFYPQTAFDSSGNAHLASPVQDSSSVKVGLRIDAQADLLPLVGDNVERTDPKAVSRVNVHVRKTRGIKAGIVRTDATTTQMQTARPRDVQSNYGAEMPFTGPLEVYVDGPWSRDASLRISHEVPFYCEILGVEYQVDT